MPGLRQSPAGRGIGGRGPAQRPAHPGNWPDSGRLRQIGSLHPGGSTNQDGAAGCFELPIRTSSQLVRHIQSRRADGAGLATASNDLTWIGVVLRAAKSVEGVTVRPQIVQEARIACREFRLIGKSRRRERRPTVDELAKLDAHFATRDRRASLPRIRHFGVSVCGPFRERNDVKSDEVDHGHEHQLAEPAGKPALEKIFRTARG